jgi:alginate O-acetyltransferase complex protein AlgI
MIFNSWTYLLFLGLSVFIFWCLPRRARIYFVCAASIFFYSLWKWQFAILIVLSAYIGYLLALYISEAKSEKGRRFWLGFSLVVSLGLLCFFKYSYFIYDNAFALANILGITLPPPAFKVILPLGISFYTFHIVSYTVDVFRRTVQPQKSFPLFLAYVIFWPQLIAGPILRAGEVITQFLENRKFSLDNLVAGSERVMIGLFKKVFLADRLAILTDQIYSLDPRLFSAFDVWVAAFLFGLQIYFDFSAYSDIALGSAKMLGIHFPENFYWPYLSRSPREFWKRWHISLSSWIRDYLYLPLTGQPFKTKSEGGLGIAAEDSDKSNVRRNLSLFLTWFLMGLWHGAGWTYILWGVYHATVIFVFRIIKPLRNLGEKFPVLGWLATLFLAMAGWIAFRSNSVTQAAIMFGKIVDPRQYDLWAQRIPAIGYYSVLIILVFLITGYFIKLWREKHQNDAIFVRFWLLGKTLALIAVVFLAITYLQTVNQFIYFQF